MTSSKESCVVDEVITSQQDAAERIRSHLVALRGGAPFLSPDDSALLVKWLFEGVGEARILRGLELAADARRKKRLRTPLALKHAKRFLTSKRATPAAPLLAADTGHSSSEHFLSPLTQAVSAPPPQVPWADSRDRALAEALCEELRALPETRDEQQAGFVIARCGAYLATRWECLPEATRQGFHDIATTELADVALLLDEDTLAPIVEEHARGLFRSLYPTLSASAIWSLIQP